jgi:hypothetical protein
MNQVEAYQILAILTDQYPKLRDAEFTDRTAKQWSMSFADRSADDVMAAVQEHMKDPQSGKFFPKVGEIAAKLPEKAILLIGPAKSAAMQLRERRQKINKQYHDRGLMPYSEAREQGISSAEWERMVCSK